MTHRYTVLMYHAVPATPGPHGGADAHYSVDLPVFVQQMDELSTRGLRGMAVERQASDVSASDTVGITFDDGHETNFGAARVLADRGWSGTFFVNSSTVGTPHFLSWPQLQEMVDMGMSIQSHAHRHRYMDDLSPDEQFDELHRSKVEIEQHLGRPVGTFAPPGGRTSRELKHLAARAGYVAMCTSRVGLYTPQGESAAWDIPRFAVLSGTPLSQIGAWVTQDRAEVRRQVLRYRALRAVKTLLGNAGYERLRSAALGAEKVAE
jgi:peptidoglycan/xylan/chitin deacetylase (PgdA/CDA1 family)